MPENVHSSLLIFHVTVISTLHRVQYHYPHFIYIDTEVRRVICLSYIDTLRESMSIRDEIIESQSMANYIRYQFPFFEMPNNSIVPRCKSEGSNFGLPYLLKHNSQFMCVSALELSTHMLQNINDYSRSGQ